MSYLDKAIGPPEILLYRGRIHGVFRWRLVVVLAAALAFIGWLSSSYPAYFSAPYALIAAAVAAVFCVRALLPVWTLEMGLTDCRLIVKRGLIAYNTHELELNTIEEVNVSQSWAGRIFDYGTINIQGIGIDTLALDQVAEPLAFRKAIETALRSKVRAR